MADTDLALQNSLRMGEMRVSDRGDPLRTLLGSCVGLALFDRQKRIGGLAHIVLPDSRGKTDHPGKFIDTAIPLLIENMRMTSTQRKPHEKKLNLTAIMAGGASMFSASSATLIGAQNIAACRQWLEHAKIPLVGEHCGGRKGRRMTLNTSTGKVAIEIVGQAPIELPSQQRQVDS